MKPHFAVASAALGAALLLGSPDARAACSLGTMNIPVTVDGHQATVKAQINGEPVRLILDSGAFYSMIDGRFAAQHKLKPYQVHELGTRFTTAVSSITTGAGGADIATGVVLASTFGFVGQSFKDVAFLADNNTFKANSIADNDAEVGLLGQNFLHQFDDEYDLKNGVVRMVQPNGCQSAVLAYWVKAPMTYSVVPLEGTGRNDLHTVAIITINGAKMRAVFDTGAARSFITRRAAARAGVKTSDAEVKPAGFTSGLDRDKIESWVAPFASIKIGDEEIKNGRLTIGASDADFFDVLIGADFFLAHHVYVANSQGKLYFTYSGGKVFDIPTAEPTTASGDAKPPK